MQGLHLLRENLFSGLLSPEKSTSAGIEHANLDLEAKANDAKLSVNGNSLLTLFLT